MSSREPPEAEAGAPIPPRPARQDGSSKLLAGGLGAIVGLSSLAFAQPIHDLLRRTPEFFAIRDLSAADLAALIVTLAVGPALVLGAPALLARRLRPAWTAPAAAAAIAGLATVICLQALRALPAPAAVSMAATAGIGAAWAWLRFSAARSLGLLLSVAALIAPALLVISPDVRDSIAAPGSSDFPEAVDTGARAPIVFLVFDEWSLTSILDRNGDIDSERMPNLAAFAERATWYPNATAASDLTQFAVPAMLSGATAEKRRAANLASYPVSLFTVLAASHDLHAFERVTSLCPPALNLSAETVRVSKGAKLGLLASDLRYLWLHLTLPTQWARSLPDVGGTWSGFGLGAAPAESSARRPERRAFPWLYQTDRAHDFRTFVRAIEAPGERPAFYFFHSMLPHMPWEYLPSGRRYARSRHGVHGLTSERRWDDSAWNARHHHKRYLLQVEFVDLLLGELVDRLEATDMFDRSLIVLAVDHGVSFRPGRSRRRLEAAAAEDEHSLDIASVPLLIKAPFQQQAVVDEEPISLVELPGRILQLAGSRPGTFSTSLAVAATGAMNPQDAASGGTLMHLMRGLDTGYVEIPARRNDWRRRQAREQASLLGESNDPMTIGVLPHLHGEAVADFPVRETGARVEFLDAWVWNGVDTAEAEVPVLVEGSLAVQVLPDELADHRNLALALNGVVAATVTPHDAPRSRSRFAALLPESRLRDGFNRLEAFLVEESSNRIRLERLSSGQDLFSLTRDSQGNVQSLVRESDSRGGRRLPLVRPSPRGLYGHVDSVLGNVVRGWAIDDADPGGVEHIVAFVGERQVAAGHPGRERSDVADRYGDQHLQSGYILRLPRPASDHRGHYPDWLRDDPGALHREGVKVYAVSRRGVAARLSASYRPLTREDDVKEVLPITDGRRLPVQPAGHGFGGQVDLVTSRDGRTFVEGWAGDLELGEAPRRIAIYRDGEFLAGGAGRRPRRDVAETHDDAGLLRTGFRIDVPDSPPPVDFAERHRVFALMGRGVAVELPLPASRRQADDSSAPE